MAAHAVDILLVEDTPTDVQLTLHVFHKYNISNRVDVVEDGAEALDYLFHVGRYADLQGAPTVILLDLKLPKVTGLEVLRQIRADSRTGKIPVVILTSSREDADIERCYEVGVNSYIVKPVDFGQFGEAIRQVGLYWLMLNQPPTVSSRSKPITHCVAKDVENWWNSESGDSLSRQDAIDRDASP